MTEDQYDSWYKSRFNKLNERPPVESWSNISTRLDVQDVWKGVDSKLNLFDRRKTIRRRATYGLSLLLLLLLFGTYIIGWGTKNKIGNTGISEKEIQNGKHGAEANLPGHDIGAEPRLLNAKSGDKTEHGKINNGFAVNKKKRFPVREIGSGTVAESFKSVKPTVINQNKVETGPWDSTASDVSAINANEHVAIADAKAPNREHSTSLSSKNDISPKSDGRNDAVNVSGVGSTRGDESDAGDSEAINQNNSIPPSGHNNILVNDDDRTTIADEDALLPIKISFVPNVRNDSISPVSAQVYNADSNQVGHVSLTNAFYGWNAGVTGSVNNIWLFNQLAFDGLNSNSLNETNLDFGYAYGVSCGYDFNSTYGAELNWYLNSQRGQKYHIYNEGQYQADYVNLDYSVVNLTLKHRNTSINRWVILPQSHNLMIGINYGFLIRSSNNLEAEQGQSVYSATDYGVRLGYEYEILVYNRIIFSSALIGDFGLKNIYKGNSLTPGNFNRTHTAALGLQIGIKYLFK